MCTGNDFLYLTTELRVPSPLTVGSCKIKMNSHSFLLQEETTRAQTESNQSKPKSSNAHSSFSSTWGSVMICWVSCVSGSGSHNTCSLSHGLSLAPTPHLLLSLVVLPQCWHLRYAATSLQLSLQLHQQLPLVSHRVKSQFLSRTFSVLHLLCSPKSYGIPIHLSSSAASLRCSLDPSGSQFLCADLEEILQKISPQ